MDANRMRGRPKPKQCCNPWNRHKKVVTRTLREISHENAAGVDGLSAFVGQNICSACYNNPPTVSGSRGDPAGSSVPAVGSDVQQSTAASSVSTTVTLSPAPGNANLPLSREPCSVEIDFSHPTSSASALNFRPPDSENVNTALSSEQRLVETDQSHANTSMSTSEFELTDTPAAAREPQDDNVAGPSVASFVPLEEVGLDQGSSPTLSVKFPLCSFGRELKDTCSLDMQPQFTKDLPFAQANALLWSSNLWTAFPEDATVCCIHMDKFLGFDLQPSGKLFDGCSDPMSKHFKTVTTGLKKANALTVVKALKINVTLSVGDPICGNCFSEIYKAADQAREEEDLSLSQSQGSQKTPTVLSPSIEKESLKICVENLGMSPIIPPNYTAYGKINYAKRKVEEMETSIRKKICSSLGIEETAVQTEQEVDSKCFHDIMGAIKEKLLKVDKPTKIQLLTLCPKSWNILHASKFFGVSRYMIKRARALAQEHGIFARPLPRTGKTLSTAAKNAVVAFYCHDDNSRLMPGKKDFVSMGGGVHEQKRLLLCTLSELYNKFRNEYPLDKFPDLKIGFSMFCVLRPKYCVLAGSSGTHNVCVCVLHQNLKLKLWALKIKSKLRDLIHKFVCPAPTRECMLALCPNCPKLDAIIDILKSEVRQQMFDDEEDDLLDDESLKAFFEQDVQYSEWTSTDRSELLTKQSTIEELIIEVAKSLRKVIPHHFVSDEQSQFLKNLKANLLPSQAIVLMDFSMNYSCLIQNASQSYHWSKIQCTVHPVVIYYKGADGELAHKSLCFISPDVDHDVPMVQEFQERIISYIKQNLPHILELIYVTDGCAAQYKNCKTFAHLTQHEKLYGLKASWFFFATSHGKSASDGIGGTVKRLATLESLRRPMNNQIVNAEKLYEFCVNSTLSETIQFFFVSTQDVLKRRLSAANSQMIPMTIPGTRSFHHFYPLTESNVGCKRVSSDEEFSLVHPAFVESTTEEQWEENSFVAVLVNPKIYIGLITDLNAEEKEADISLLFPPLPSLNLSWSEDLDSYVAPYPSLLSKVNLTERMDNTYLFPAGEILKLRFLAELKRKELRKK